MRIGIDIDDTLTNTKEKQILCWQEYYNWFPNPNYTIQLPENINRFGDKYIDNFWDTYRAALYDAEYKQNVSEALYKLKCLRHELDIITCRKKSKFRNLEEKLRASFEENHIPIDNIYTDSEDKGLTMVEHDIDLLIDDDPMHCQSAINQGKQAILFNEGIEFDGPQTNEWLEVLDIVTRSLHK